MAKIDLADGYYCFLLHPQLALSLAVVIPSDHVADPNPLIAIPLSLPMGWSQSPPYFCAFTETITDMANNPNIPTPPSHPLLHTTQTPPHDLIWRTRKRQETSVIVTAEVRSSDSSECQ
jgi:hypothetical protein